MSTPLRDNPGHLARLCQLLELGRPLAEVTPVPGGFHHRMWRLQSERGEYAIKQLAPDTDLTGGKRNPHNQSEHIADLFARRGLPSLPALQANGEYLHILHNQGYLVYPWTDARALPRQRIGEHECRVVAALMARLHQAGDDIRGPGTQSIAALTAADLRLGIDLAVRSNTRDARLLRDNESSFQQLLEEQTRAAEQLAQGRQATCHGDLDHKNVLWDAAGQPLVIDWESARLLNPTYELLLEAMDWSGITSEFRPALFQAMLQSYREAGGVLDKSRIDAAFTCIQGEWLSWLLYNVGRAADVIHDETHLLGNQQVDLALSAILRLRRLTPRLKRLIEHV